MGRLVKNGKVIAGPKPLFIPENTVQSMSGLGQAPVAVQPAQPVQAPASTFPQTSWTPVLKLAAILGGTALIYNWYKKSKVAQERPLR